jgi:vacuolar-type H+-ATPase subunit F/Vma7
VDELGPGAGHATEIAAIGSELLVAGFGLAGVHVHVADDEAAVRAAWSAVAPSAGLVVLSAAAAQVLAVDRLLPDAPLSVVLP